MGKAFDIGLEELAGAGACGCVPEESSQLSVDSAQFRRRETQDPPSKESSQSSVYSAQFRRRETQDPFSEAEGGAPVGEDSASGRTFYLETFGCQMNEHDSEKVAGVLLARGYKQVERPEEAGVILYNTCSIREKAAQKVFSRLGELRPEIVREKEEEAILQGLKPHVTADKMSELKLRPPVGSLTETQDSPLETERGAPGSSQWTVDSSQFRRRGTQDNDGTAAAGNGETIPQGLKPDDGGGVMSDLKVRPPVPSYRGEKVRTLETLQREPQDGGVKIFRQKNGVGKIIGVLGCLAQQEGERIFARAPWVNLVCGSASYRKLPELLAQLEAGNRRVTGLETETDETFQTEVTRRDNPWRAYLTIIEGCNKKCSFCVVPYTRGPERSRTSASVLEEVRQLADAGYTEVQLLGQTVNSYADPSARKMRFSELLVAAAEVRGIRRVRFTTSHPRDFGKDIVEAIEAVPAICEHVHLPVQSGSTKVLRAMARTYSRDEYLEKIAMMRKAKREISITTDLIVGFPGETERDFEETLSLIDLVQYDGAFCFKYSPRPNTPSLKMEDVIPEEEKSRRLAVLLERQREIQRARNERLVGNVLEVMVEGKSRRENASRNGTIQWSGHTSSNRVMNFTSKREESLGDYVRVRVTGATPNSLVGEAVGEELGI